LFTGSRFGRPRRLIFPGRNRDSWTITAVGFVPQVPGRTGITRAELIRRNRKRIASDGPPSVCSPVAHTRNRRRQIKRECGGANALADLPQPVGHGIRIASAPQLQTVARPILAPHGRCVASALRETLAVRRRNLLPILSKRRIRRVASSPEFGLPSARLLGQSLGYKSARHADLGDDRGEGIARARHLAGPAGIEIGATGTLCHRAAGGNRAFDSARVNQAAAGGYGQDGCRQDGEFRHKEESAAVGDITGGKRHHDSSPGSVVAARKHPPPPRRITKTEGQSVSVS